MVFWEEENEKFNQMLMYYNLVFTDHFLYTRHCTGYWEQREKMERQELQYWQAQVQKVPNLRGNGEETRKKRGPKRIYYWNWHMKQVIKDKQKMEQVKKGKEQEIQGAETSKAESI